MYKYCIVPKCTNTTVKTPEKLFFNVPKDPKLRKKWYSVINREDKITPSAKTARYCCEDHFDIDDLELGVRIMELDEVFKERKQETIIINDIKTQTSLVKIEVVDETCDKSQTEQNQHNNEHEDSSMIYVSLKTEPVDDDACCKSSLYADHYIKDELVIGPTVLQNQNGVLENPPETKNDLNQSQCSETSFNEQPLSLKELPYVGKESQTRKKLHYNKKPVSADIPSLQPERSNKQKTESRKKIKRMKNNNECGNEHNKASKRKHRVDKTGKNRRRLYKCDVAGCQKAYYWQANLSCHKQIHTDKTGKNRRRLYKCDVAGCQKAYYWQANLSCHKQIHTDTTKTGKNRRRLYKCDVAGCQKAYYWQANLSSHKQIHTDKTGKNRRRLYKCNVAGCQKAYNWKANLSSHKQIHTDKTGKNRRRLYKCDVAGCQKAYYWQANLSSHKQIHTGEKPFICEWEGCGSRFTSSVELARHTRKHTGERPFACAPCQLQFSRSDYLSRHMKSQGHMINTTDTGKNRRRPYKCNVAGCQKVCYNRMQLTAHKQTHTGSKPYICNWEGCGWRFGRQEELKRHTRSKHTGQRPFSCAPCQLRFARLDTLRKHMRTKKHKLKENKKG